MLLKVLNWRGISSLGLGGQPVGVEEPSKDAIVIGGSGSGTDNTELESYIGGEWAVRDDAGILGSEKWAVCDDADILGSGEWVVCDDA
ncbi:hypothetical protein BGX27_006150, partial [Mortierella sp. AM989]